MGFSGFQFEDSGAVWDEFIGLTAGRPCDMAEMTSERLRRERHLRWPCPSIDHPGTERLYRRLTSMICMILLEMRSSDCSSR